jgi:hypothetical protein
MSGDGSTMTWSGPGNLDDSPSQDRRRRPVRRRPVRRPVSNVDDDDESRTSDSARERDGRPDGQATLSSRSSRDSDRTSAGVYGDYDDVVLEIEDIQEYLVSSIEDFIMDVSTEFPQPPSLFTNLDEIHRKIINPTDTSVRIPIYFKKWMIDQAVNGRQGMVTKPIELSEIKNIGLYDYFLNNTDMRILSLQKILLQQLVMYILALRTGDLSFLPDIASEIKPKLV